MALTTRSPIRSPTPTTEDCPFISMSATRTLPPMIPVTVIAAIEEESSGIGAGVELEGGGTATAVAATGTTDGCPMSTATMTPANEPRNL